MRVRAPAENEEEPLPDVLPTGDLHEKYNPAIGNRL